MDVVDWYRIFSWLTVAANAATACVVVLAAVSRINAGAARVWSSVVIELRAQALALVALVASAAMVGSLYLSEGAHLVPCRLCWFQRTAMYPLAVLAIVAMIRRDRAARPYLVVLAALGLVISTWHYLVEWFPDLESAGGSCDPLNPCSLLPLPRRYGFISIPYMAGSAFLFVLVVLAASRTPKELS